MKTHKTFILSIGLFIGMQLTGQQTETVYLSGTGNDNTVEWDFYCTEGRKSGEWTKIAVPSCWELEGFGNYNYGLDLYNKDKPGVDIADEKGKYKHVFEIPGSWEDKVIFIVFEASMTDTEVKINGKKAGPVHQGAFYEFKYNITDLVNVGKENKLEVTVSKLSSNESVNMAERRGDYWVFGGIFRPVYLEAKPMSHIRRFALDARANGNFMAEVFLSDENKADKIQATIKKMDGSIAAEPFITNIDAQDKVIIKTDVRDPLQWTPEYPHLYVLNLQLKKKDKTIHEVEERFGFRTVEVKDRDGIYVNGQKVHLKGVNRHSFWPSSGRTTSKSLSIEDVMLMKEMNMNAVRMSHYPPDKHFLDACDSLGLFVLDELAGWQKPPYDTEVGEKLVKEMVVRDVNHPCIIIWDNGNEGGWNTELDDEFAKYDPQNRRVLHPWAIFNGFDNQHYKPYDYGLNSWFHGKNIFFPTEFLHGLYDGGHGAGLDDHWNKMIDNPLSAGGFLWVFSDEGVVRTDQDGKLDTDGNHAPDGIVGPYREKEGSFFAIKEIWSPVYINKPYLTDNFNGKLTVENRFYYTNLNDCKFTWTLGSFPLPGKDKEGFQAIKKGTIPGPYLEPWKKGTLELMLPEDWRKADVLYLKAEDPHGREIYTWSWPVKYPEKIAEKVIDKEDATSSITVKEKDKVVHLSCDDLRIAINKSNATLEQVKKDEQSISLINGPLSVTDTSKLESFKHYRQDDGYVIEAEFDGDLQYVKWTLLKSGWLKLEYRCGLWDLDFDYMGITFDYPEDQVKGMKWLGHGPYRVWKNRLKGMELNVWQKDYNNGITGYKWEYPEFKGYHSNLYWAQFESNEMPFTVATANEDMYLRVFTPEPAPQHRNTHPAFPEGDLSLLFAIPPIGTKFREAKWFGPQSQKNMYNGTLDGTVYFYFGALDGEYGE